MVNTNVSDTNSDSFNTKFHKFKSDRVVLDNSDQSVTQETINQAILIQLATIEKCLDNIEKSNVCKIVDTAKIKNESTRCSVQASNNELSQNHDTPIKQNMTSEQSVPTLSALRSDKLIQQQVYDRLNELSNLSQGT